MVLQITNYIFGVIELRKIEDADFTLHENKFGPFLGYFLIMFFPLFFGLFSFLYVVFVFLCLDFFFVFFFASINKVN